MMESEANSAFAREIEAALGWWREAGVDCDYLDTPREWLAPPASPPPPGARRGPDVSPHRALPTPAEAVLPPAPAFDPAAMPGDLAAFREWWMREPALDDGHVARRVAPEGEAGAPLMVIVPEPEPDDAGRLLAGPQGRLLDAILRAMGMRREEAYLASAMVRHTPAPDWRALEAAGLGRVLLRHIELAAPQRVLVLGMNILPLIGHELPQGSAHSSRIDHHAGTVPLLAGRSLPALLRNPRMKAQLWKAWLTWTQ